MQGTWITPVWCFRFKWCLSSGSLKIFFWNVNDDYLVWHRIIQTHFLYGEVLLRLPSCGKSALFNTCLLCWMHFYWLFERLVYAKGQAVQTLTVLFVLSKQFAKIKYNYHNSYNFVSLFWVVGFWTFAKQSRSSPKGGNPTFCRSLGVLL